ncbi:MAG: glycosyltransferase family 2 protein [Candidatus Sumerlaeia bacterium]
MSDRKIELSVVMPCLNEADTLATCIEKAQKAMEEHQICGEIIVSDNGSTDGSREIAEKLGARLIHAPERGYGNALMYGIEAARGKYILMGDADDSYDFLELPKFVDKLREGYDLVQGCRLPRGGGKVLPGAMPFTHRWFGNPMFSFLARVMFHSPIHDIYCGMRGFTPEWYARLGQRCTGMEFATEMIIKSSLMGARITEVPITLHPDGRKQHEPHLRTLRDGWRTLRFFMIFCPKWLFLAPGMLLFLLGLLGYAVVIPTALSTPNQLGIPFLVCSSLLMIMGYQAVLFSFLANAFAAGEAFIPVDPLFLKIFRGLPIEKGLPIGLGIFLLGMALLIIITIRWLAGGMQPLGYDQTIRWIMPGFVLSALGFQTIMSGFFISILGLRRKV